MKTEDQHFYHGFFTGAVSVGALILVLITTSVMRSESEISRAADSADLEQTSVHEKAGQRDRLLRDYNPDERGKSVSYKRRDLSIIASVSHQRKDLTARFLTSVDPETLDGYCASSSEGLFATLWTNNGKQLLAAASVFDTTDAKRACFEPRGFQQGNFFYLTEADSVQSLRILKQDGLAELAVKFAQTDLKGKRKAFLWQNQKKTTQIQIETNEGAFTGLYGAPQAQPPFDTVTDEKTLLDANERLYVDLSAPETIETYEEGLFYVTEEGEKNFIPWEA